MYAQVLALGSPVLHDMQYRDQGYATIHRRVCAHTRVQKVQNIQLFSNLTMAVPAQQHALQGKIMHIILTHLSMYNLEEICGIGV